MTPFPSSIDKIAVCLGLFCLIALSTDALAKPMLPASGDPWAVTVTDSSTDAVRQGAQVYVSCASCHLADGGGRPDGDIPRLAGQPAKIIESKLKRIRSGEVFLPVMAPFAVSLSPMEVTAVAAYIASLPRPRHVGTGPDKSLVSESLTNGQARYTETCAACHGAKAEGFAALDSPRLCGQHYGYILRRVDEVVSGARGEPHAGMAAVVATLDPTDLESIADYLSRDACEPPEAQ